VPTVTGFYEFLVVFVAKPGKTRLIVKDHTELDIRILLLILQQELSNLQQELSNSQQEIPCSQHSFKAKKNIS